MASFTDQIKKIPITDYAQRIGYTLVRKGSRYVSLKEHDSIMIDTEKNAYWQNSQFVMGRKGGAGSIIDFAMNMRGYDLNTALRELATMYGVEGNREAKVPFNAPKFEKPSNEKKREKGDIELPKAANNNTAVIKYLRDKRKIKPEIIESFIGRGMLYQDVRRNCVFHTDRFGCVRSTGEIKFVGDLNGCDYDECFLVKPTHPSKLNNTLIVTEAVIDQMSVMSFLADKRDYQGYWYLALGGTNKAESIFNVLNRNPDIQTVVLCLDNDDAGRKATALVSERLKELGIKVVDFPPKAGKDWNEYIQILAEREAMQQIQKQEKQEESDFFKQNPPEMEQSTESTQQPEITIADKLEAFSDELVKDIANYYISHGGDPAAIIAAPDNVSVASISAVTDSIMKHDITVEQAVGIYAAMQYLEEWNVSNYQQQIQTGAKAEYVFDEGYMDQMADSLCRFAKSGKDADYLMQVVQDSIAVEQEQFLSVSEPLIEVESTIIQTVLESQSESEKDEVVESSVQQRDYSQAIDIALESTNDYHDDSFKVTDGHHLYRWVCLSDNGLTVEPLDDKVYADPMDARMIKHLYPALHEVEYDTLLDKAYYNYNYGVKEKQEMQDKVTAAIKEKDAEIRKLQEQLKTGAAELAPEQKQEPVSVIRAWTKEVALDVHKMFPDAVRQCDILSGRVSDTLAASDIEAASDRAMLVIESDKWNQYVEHKLQTVDYTLTPPVVICEFSESSIFEVNKEYSLREFSDLMGEHDKAHHEGHKKGLEYYNGDFMEYLDKAAEDPNSPYAEFAAPYHKTDFVVSIPGIGEYRERQDIGDGIGSTLDMLRGIESFQPLMPMLDRVYEMQKAENERNVSGSMERRIAIISPDSPKWYQEINDIRVNNSMTEIVHELAERHRFDTGRDPFDETPLSTVKAPALIVAAAAEFSKESLQMLSDTAKDGVATIAFADADGNQYPIDVNVRFIDMAIQYVSDFEQPVVAQDLNPLESQLESEAASEPEAKSANHFSYADIHVISYRMDALAESFESMPTDEYESAKAKYKQLSDLYQKVTAETVQHDIVLTADEQALVDESKQWLTDQIASMDSSERVKYELTEGIKTVLSSEEYKNWLDTTSRHYVSQYSFTNAILVYLQNKDASITMPYEKWKDYGRQVQAGSVGIRIKAPKMAYEASKGQIFRAIKKGLLSELAANPGDIAKYQLGMSKLTFTMNPQNHVIGLQVDGKDRMIFASDEHLKQFIERQVLGKEPVGYKVVSVFDISQTEIPEQIWIKESKMLPDEKPVLDENGEIQRNKRGEVLIFNSEARQARFQTELPHALESGVKEPLAADRVSVLYECLKAVNERHNVPVYERAVDEDPILRRAAGYFDRSDNIIVIRSEMSIEEKLKVLFHETAHADLHGDLAKLAEEMNLDKRELGTNIKEIQAESVAYALGQQYGIETDQDSFSYLAAYTKGFELQDLQRSMSVIKKEIALLNDDLQAELEERGYDRNVNRLSEKSFSMDKVSEICADYIAIATEQFRKAETESAEMPDLEARCTGSKEAMHMLADCNGNCEQRMADATNILAACKVLASSHNLTEQQQQIQIVRKAIERINVANERYQSAVEAALDMQREKMPNNLRKDFLRDSVGVVQRLAAQYPQLAKLSDVQQAYIASSKYLKKQASLLNSTPDKFVQMACDRAAQLPNVAAKNGTFVEIVSCEKWTQQKVFEDGTLCHPKYAERTIQNAEPLLEKLIAQERENDRFVPTTQVVLSAYAVVDGKLQGLSTKIDVGDGEQTGLLDHFNQILEGQKGDKSRMQAFNDELLKGGAEMAKYAEKVYVPQPEIEQRENVNTSRSLEMTTSEWQATIEHGRETDTHIGEPSGKENHDQDSPSLT